jgi:hypothetical protein
MLFPRNALASGPQAYLLAEKKTVKVKAGKLSASIDNKFSVE